MRLGGTLDGIGATTSLRISFVQARIADNAAAAPAAASRAIVVIIVALPAVLGGVLLVDRQIVLVHPHNDQCLVFGMGTEFHTYQFTHRRTRWVSCRLELFFRRHFWAESSFRHFSHPERSFHRLWMVPGLQGGTFFETSSEK